MFDSFETFAVESKNVAKPCLVQAADNVVSRADVLSVTLLSPRIQLPFSREKYDIHIDFVIAQSVRPKIRKIGSVLVKYVIGDDLGQFVLCGYIENKHAAVLKSPVNSLKERTYIFDVIYAVATDRNEINLSGELERRDILL